MSRHHLTASRLPMTCLWWARPEVVLDPRTTSDAAQFGSCTHKAVEHYVSGTVVDLDVLAEKYGIPSHLRAELHDTFDAFREWWDVWGRARLALSPEAKWRCEVPFAFDPATWTARKLPTEGERDYAACSPTEVPGTVDLVAVDPRRAVVVDIKTGRGQHTLVEHQDQLLHGALCVGRTYGVREVTIVVAHVTARGVAVDERTLDEWDIDSVGLGLSARVYHLPSAVPVPSTKDCHFCPGKGSCPVTLAAVEAAAADDNVELPAVLAGPVTDQAHARKLFDVLPRLEAWVDVQRRHLQAYAKASPIDLGDGRCWGVVEKPGREAIDLAVKGALPALSQALGDLAEKAVEMSTTKAALERAVRAKLVEEHVTGRGAIKTRMDALLKRLRELGALKKGAGYTVFEAYETSAAEKEGDE
jgi:hypothetical protein